MKTGARLDWRQGSEDALQPEPSPLLLQRSQTGSDAPSLGARLSQLLRQETPDTLLDRPGEFRSVEEALKRSSSAYQILRQLEDSGLKDCARCTRELEQRLAGNPHYVVLAKIAEAERAVLELTTTRL